MTQVRSDSTQNFVFNLPAVANACPTPEPNLPTWMNEKPNRCTNFAGSREAGLDPCTAIRRLRMTVVFSISDY
jgi:hypothetical protein